MTTDPAVDRRLVRHPDDRMVAGVCAAVARYTDTDPVLWRVAVGVLALFGGAGLVLYGIGWLLIPEAGQDRSVAEQLLHRPGGMLRIDPHNWVLWVVGAVALSVLLDHHGAPTQHGAGVPLLVLAGLGYLVYRRRGRVAFGVRIGGPSRGGSAMAGDSDPVGWAAPPPGHEPPPGAPPPLRPPASGWVPPPPPPPAAPPSQLGRVTLSLAVLVTGVLLLLRVGGETELTAPRIVAAALVVVGLGLVVGAWVGRGRGLVALGLLLTLALGPVTAGHRVATAGVGSRYWTPVAAGGSYRVAVGDATLDLARVAAAPAGGPIRADIGAGHLLVKVPAQLAVHLVAHVGVGDISVPGDSRSGLNLDEDTTLPGPAPSPPVEVDVSVHSGLIEVQRV